MMKSRLVIGLPVYNGQNYISEAIDSILAQSYTDFTLIITDNASTDKTEEICRQYEKKDSRVTYIRRPKNIGAAENFNQAFWDTEGEYFKWASHDDILEPTFIEKCLTVLENDKNVVLAYSKARKIDAAGKVIGNYDYDMRMDHNDPIFRFKDLILVNHFCISAFGIYRREILKKTPLIGKYVGSDRTLIAEIGLYGKQIEVPEYLFLRRDHPNASTAKYGQYNRLAWFDPNKRTQLNLKYWKMGAEYRKAVNRVPLNIRTRMACYGSIIRWYIQKRGRLMDDFIIAIYQIFPFTRNITKNLKRAYLSIRGGSK